MAGSTQADRTVACLVVFHPDWDAVRATIRRISPELSNFFLYTNSPAGAEASSLLEAAHPTPLTFLGTGANEGLGKAYNDAVVAARESGANYLLLLDQDSAPPAGMITGLEQLMAKLTEEGVQPAVVGPYPLDPKGRRVKLARRHGPQSPSQGTPVDFLISSGSLLSIATATRVGHFRESFFIDAIDIEWCMRAWKKGRSVWVSTTIEMPHRIGRGIIELPFGLRLADQPPERIYTYLRNQLAMFRLAHVPMRWKVKFLAALPLRSVVYLLRSKGDRATLKALALGLYHGLINRLGPPQAAWKAIGRR